MCQYSSHAGVASDWHLVHLGARALGGAGLVIAEATAVSPEGRISPGDAGIWGEQHIEPIARINRFVKDHGAIPGLQLAHAGRKASVSRPWEGDATLDDEHGGWPTLGPSAIAFGDKISRAPRMMTDGDISKVMSDFAEAAKRALSAGVEFLELHFAHGYLVHEFLSPLSNQRTDAYGGTFENRIRIALEITAAVREVWPEELPLAARLSCTDWVVGGWDLEQSVDLSTKLKAAGVDLIDCSSGANTPNVKIPAAPGYQVPFAERIRHESKVLTAAVGLITDPKQADAIVREGKADLVLMAREFLREPNWPLMAAKVLGQSAAIEPPIQYGRAFK